jgi:murein DD-endopeptidase MepM/ murein hydrolase activator NlpD
VHTTVIAQVLLSLLPLQAPALKSNVAPPNALVVASSPVKPVNGSPVLFSVRARTPLKSLSGEWQGRRVFFDFDASADAWYGFAGVELDTAAGQHRLALDAVPLRGERISSSHYVATLRARYRTISLSVPRQYTEPDAETLARINEERAWKTEAFKRITPERLWAGPFASPVDNVTTEPFGVQRTFNGVRQTVHQGLDFRASTGTPIAAMNGGTVILAREMFYEGGLVVIDHGQGLLSLYMHLSAFYVKEGDRVSKRQVIALSGESGRATGPHLHAGIRWQGVYVDPATLLKIQLP